MFSLFSENNRPLTSLNQSFLKEGAERLEQGMRQVMKQEMKQEMK